MGFFKGLIDYLSPKDDTVPVTKLGRNDACWCGSGLKYKKCHLAEDEKKLSKRAAACCVTKS